MPGPLPKKQIIRRRANKTVTSATLPPERSPRERTPYLPAHPDGEDWHNMARRWWKDVWNSPMAAEYLRADEHALFLLVLLVDKFWKDPDVSLAREIRLRQQSFGLTPMDRRRLEWQVAQAEEAKDKHEMRRSRRARIINSDDDPREVLGE